ncbi:vWA domain-containing protein [Bradyrhizobium tunisiense]|uniref:vWA domain-containing protein n=1 Tax=Bradyrhizobium tunisiense TaxID=3278709 RepID=UPI0035D750C7
MSDIEQTPFTFREFTDNPEPRCACLLLIDTSGSMGGAPIRELNSALIAFKEALSEDSLAMKRVEIAVVTFGPVRVETDFQTADSWQPPHLTASGDTPMGAAIREGLELLRRRKQQYADNAIETFRPWVFLMTDGAPTDHWEHTTELVKQGETSKGFSFWGIGVENANMEILKQICTVDRPPIKMAGLKFREMFVWLSASLKGVSGSQPGSTVKIDPPKGWTEV